MSTVAGGCKAATQAAVEAPSESIRQQKRQVRAIVRKKLREFAPEHRQIEDSTIQSIVLEAEWFKSSRKLCAYVSCPALREVDTSNIVAHILKRHDGSMQAKKLYVPRVKDKESHMQMLRVESYDDLVPNAMSILEPALVDHQGNPREDVMVTEEPVDLLLLPGLAFDLSGRRLGRGGGYYDCFLSNLLRLSDSKGWKRPLLVALAYSPQLINDPVPIDETDVPVDALVCSTGAVAISSYGKQRML